MHIWTWSPTDRTSEPHEIAAEPPPQLPAKPSIAVLPFDNMSGDPEQGYFADGITEDIITDLSKVSGLFVIGRNSSFAYKGKTPGHPQGERELGVRYVLEGSVRRAADRIRINAQMIDGTTGGHLWAERYDRGLEDIFAVQDEVTRTHRPNALRVKLTAAKRSGARAADKVDRRPMTCSVRSRQAILQFSALSSRRPAACCNRVLEIVSRDGGCPCFAFDHCLDRLPSISGTARRLTISHRARELAQKAIDTDDTEPQGNYTLALALSLVAASGRGGAPAERAIELDPNSANAYTALGTIRDFQGRHEEAPDAVHTRPPVGSRNSTCHCISKGGPC